MKTRFSAKILGLLLAVAMLASALPFSAVSAEDPAATVNYAAMEEAKKLSIETYYSQLKMFDGYGLEILADGLTVDNDWAWQANTASRYKYLNLSDAAAVWFIEKGTDFTANFADSTDISAMRFYVSGNGVDWDLPENKQVTKGYTVKLQDLPDYVSYVKLLWPIEGDNVYKNILSSVSFTKGSQSANFKRINYIKGSLGEQSKDYYDHKNVAIGGASEDAQQNHNGNANCVAQLGWQAVEDAKEKNSFDGYITYRVQPGTRFGMTVTHAVIERDSGNIDSIEVGEKLGYDDPLDFTIEIYVSADNYNFEKLENVYTSGLRQSNLYKQTYGNAVRTSEFAFVVPEDAFFVKCKFPITQNLTTTDPKAWNYCGNDVMAINKVEYTALPTLDYENKAAEVLTEANKDKFGLYDFDSNLIWENNYLNPRGSRNGVYAEYNVVPGTLFYADFTVLPNLQWVTGTDTGKGEANKDYVAKLLGFDPEKGAWEDAATITFPAGTDYKTLPSHCALTIPAAENKYIAVRMQWQNSVEEKGGGNYAFGLDGVSFSQSDLTVYDYRKIDTSLALNNDNLSALGMSGFEGRALRYSNKEQPNHVNTGIIDIEYQHDTGIVNLDYEVEPNTAFYAEFVMMWRANILDDLDKADFKYIVSLQGKNNSDWDILKTIEIKKDNVDDFQNNGIFTLYLKGEENNYSNLRVQWNFAKLGASSNNILCLTKVEKRNNGYMEHNYLVDGDINEPITAENMANFGISKIQGGFTRNKNSKGAIDIAYSNGKAADTRYVEYASVKDTDFYVKLNTYWTGNIRKYSTNLNFKYEVTIQGVTGDETTVLKTISITSENVDQFSGSGEMKITEYNLPAAENIYDAIRIQWEFADFNGNGDIKDTGACNNGICIDEVRFASTESLAAASARKIALPTYEAVSDVTVTGAEIAEQPENVKIYLGDAVDLTGLKLKFTYSDDSVRYADSGYKFKSRQADLGENTITVTCRGREITVTITGYRLLGDVNRDKAVDIRDLVGYNKSGDTDGILKLDGEGIDDAVIKEFRKALLGTESQLKLTEERTSVE